MAAGTVTEAGCATEPECQNDNQEAEHEHRHVDDTDNLPAAEPSLTIPAERLES